MTTRSLPSTPRPLALALHSLLLAGGQRAGQARYLGRHRQRPPEHRQRAAVRHGHQCPALEPAGPGQRGQRVQADPGLVVLLRRREAAIYGDKIYFGTLDARVVALNKDTGLFYVPAHHWKEDYWAEEAHYKPGSTYLGMGFRIKRLYNDHVGILRAMNPSTGKVVWQHKEKLPLWAGVLATKGNLVFTGTGDGFFKALTRKPARSCGSSRPAPGVISPPITWEQDGEQYIGVTTGYGGAIPLWGSDMAELTKPVAQGGSFWVFKLPSWDKTTAKR